MKIKTELDCDDIGCSFADSDNHQQAAFLNGLGRFWYRMYQGEIEGSKSHMQMCWIVDELNHDALTFLSALGEFAKMELEKKK